MLPCLPPANRICEQPVGPALQHHSAQWVFWMWEDPRLALSLPHPQLPVQGHGNLPSATPELPAEGFGAVLGMAFPCLWGNVGDLTAEDSIPPPLWVHERGDPQNLLGKDLQV